jgi:hypothetical protein
VEEDQEELSVVTCDLGWGLRALENVEWGQIAAGGVSHVLRCVVVAAIVFLLHVVVFGLGLVESGDEFQ